MIFTNIIKIETSDAISIPLDDKSVDLVFCSPPYENRRLYDINFKFTGQNWINWAIPRFKECLRICKGLVAWVVEGKTERFRWSGTPILLMAELIKENIVIRKPPIYYRYGIPGGGGNDWLRNDYEFIICATNDRKKLQWSDNTAMGDVPKYAPGGAMSHRLPSGLRKGQGIKTRSVCGYKNGDMLAKDIVYIPPAKANPGNVIKCNAGKGHMGSNLSHENEAPFPESLVEFFIRSFCPPNGIVCDPFCGSGTVGAVAIKTNRKAALFDIRDSQIELSKRRILEAVRNHVS